MKHEPDSSQRPPGLRRRAEARAAGRPPDAGIAHLDADAQRLVHELQVHQIELELQNAELMEARTALEVLAQQYTDLYDFAPVGYMTLDTEGAIMGANFAAAQMFNVERGGLLKRRFAAHLVASDQTKFSAFLDKVFDEGVREACEVTLRVPGRPPMALALAALPTESRALCRLVATDVTARNEAERDRFVLGKLESTGILAGGIAHDFNNLLTAILLNLEQAESLAPSDSPLAARLADAKAHTWSARSLTQQLIAFAKGAPVNLRHQHLPALIREAVRPAVSGSRVRVQFEFPDDLWSARVDEGQLSQVFRNLALNSREAMPDGGVITVSARNVTLPQSGDAALPAGDYVRVTVSDAGAGILPEVLPRIFDPYFSTKQRGAEKGMGLGLTICHAIIAKHGGTIEARSVVGTGSTFRVHLPAIRRAPDEASPPGASEGTACHRILVMDDDDAIREIIRISLEGHGHEVAVAADGHRAISLYEAARRKGRPFDLVLLDLTVRDGLGGEDTLQVLRGFDPSVRAVVMSGFSEDDSLHHPGDHGFMGVLAKPFDCAHLKDVIARVMTT